MGRFILFIGFSLIAMLGNATRVADSSPDKQLELALSDPCNGVTLNQLSDIYTSSSGELLLAQVDVAKGLQLNGHMRFITATHSLDFPLARGRDPSARLIVAAR